MVLIECRNLTLSYDLAPVVENVSFSVSDGDYLCIVGENGAGKSTLVKALLGFIKPVGGEIDYSPKMNKNSIGYLPQQSEIQKNFPASVYEVVLSGTSNSFFSFYRKEHKEKADINMKLLSISDLKNKCYRELSGGQQQRVLLARALCATERLIILDEPAAGLDPIITDEFYKLINHLNKKHNIAVIMVSHDIEGAIKNASHILHLSGNKSFFGTVNEYLKTDYLKNFKYGE